MSDKLRHRRPRWFTPPRFALTRTHARPPWPLPQAPLPSRDPLPCGLALPPLRSEVPRFSRFCNRFRLRRHLLCAAEYRAVLHARFQRLARGSRRVPSGDLSPLTSWGTPALGRPRVSSVGNAVAGPPELAHISSIRQPRDEGGRRSISKEVTPRKQVLHGRLRACRFHNGSMADIQ